MAATSDQRSAVSNGVGMTYHQAGVDVRGADAWIARMRPLIRSTRRPEVLADRGQFAGLFRLALARMRHPVLVASADGVGTKLKIAQLAGSHEAVGVDVVAMNVNDVLVYGAEPLFFLDYIALGKLQRGLMTGLLRGIVRGCRMSGCALLGGETAEMPGCYRSGEYDVAGFCVGIVDRARLIDGSAVRAGDVVVGLESSGVHANGFSLIRRTLTKPQLSRLRPDLLRPTRIYVKPVLRVLRRMPIHAMAHITGGGLARRLPGLVARVHGLRVSIMQESWPVPEIFRIIQQAGRIRMEEMMRTFNMGIGMALVCRAQDARRLIRVLRSSGVPAWSIGAIEPGPDP
jgi:phosphoribosylformylglycinamidine cyclo-ligase